MDLLDILQDARDSLVLINSYDSSEFRDWYSVVSDRLSSYPDIKEVFEGIDFNPPGVIPIPYDGGFNNFTRAKSEVIIFFDNLLRSES